MPVPSSMVLEGGQIDQDAFRDVSRPLFLATSSSGSNALLGAIAPDHGCKVMEAGLPFFGSVQRCRRAAWPRHGRTSQRRIVKAEAAADTACIEVVSTGAAVSSQTHEECEATSTYDCQEMLRWRGATTKVDHMLDSSRLIAANSHKRRKLLARSAFANPTWEVPLMAKACNLQDSPDIKVESSLITDCGTMSSSPISDSDSPASFSSAAVTTTDSPSSPSRPSREHRPDYLKWRSSRDRVRADARVASPDASTTTGGDTPTGLLSSEEFATEPPQPPRLKSRSSKSNPGEVQRESHPTSCACSSCMKMRSFMGLLNKISVRNESVIVEQLSILAPCNKQEHRKMAELIIQQALHDPIYGDLYGRTITALSIVFPQFSPLGLESLISDRGDIDGRRSQPGRSCSRRAFRFRPVSFAAQVVRCLEEEFDGVCHELQDLDDTARHRAKNAHQAETIETIETGQKVKERALACANFVAKLVLCDVLSERLLSNVVMKLLWSKQQGPEDPPPASFIECACELLRVTVGPLRWREREPEALLYFLERLSWLRDLHAEEQTENCRGAKLCRFAYPTRVRYIVLDLLEAHRGR